MTTATLVRRSLGYYRGANLAVIAGVAIAVSVLAGALLVGESVKASLRRLVLDRIGNTATVVESVNAFHDGLVEGAPLLALEGIVTNQSNGRRASKVAVYGVDDRFWKLHGRTSVSLGARQAAASAALADELAAKPGEMLLVKIEKPSAIPAESLHGRKEDPAETFALRLHSVAGRDAMGEFSLRPQQGSVKAIFIPLATAGKPNMILSTQPGPMIERALGRNLRLEDLGLRFDGNHLHHASGLLTESVASAVLKTAAAEGLHVTPALTYLANTISIGSRTVPYSLVAATDLNELGAKLPADAPPNAIILNEWAAADLSAKSGDSVEMEYYVWH